MVEIGAYFDDSISLKYNKKTGYYKPLVYVFLDGKGKSNNPNSAIVRPLRKILEEGKPAGKVSYILFKDENKHYILGSFSHTKKHLIFFPGINMRLLYSSNEIHLQRGFDFISDHITLDKNMITWHYSDLSKNKTQKKLPTEKTNKITNSLYLWFLWGTQPGELEPLPNRQFFYAHGSVDEIDRKVELISKAQGGTELVITSNPDKPEGSHYWNFEFFVSNKIIDMTHDIVNFGIHPMYSPNFPSIVKEDRKIVPAKIFPVHIPGYSGTIFIEVSKIKASLPEPSFMTPGSIIKLNHKLD